MQTSLAQAPQQLDAQSALPPLSSKQLYLELERGDRLHGNPNARAYLEHQLQAARALPVEIPSDINALGDYIREHSIDVGNQYREYLDARKAGAPRRYFTNKSHAMYFIKGAAPTKLVDGSWLYGLLDRWDDPDFRPLIQTYLEELGDGIAEKNHVVLYKKLLAGLDCDQWRSLDDSHFIQGAIQLALAGDAEHFLPEIIGYNLGYEQLPLHLLITAYELNELGIDPYYFTLHITVDNAGTGHAHKALQALLQLQSRFTDSDALFRRVVDGYRLNDLGASTTSVIADFDLEAELVDILKEKSVVGQNMHSDYCRVAGRSINDWLAEPAQIPRMLAELENAGWIKRGEAAENSRFWRLIQSERAEMFGVFSSYEQQILSDWIATPRYADEPETAGVNGARVISFRARQRAMEALGASTLPREHAHKPRGIIRHHSAKEAEQDAADDGSALRQLEQQLAAAGSKPAAMAMLTELMSPARHHSAAGLMATRIYRQLLA